jgi:hypothetical protein
MDRFRSIREPTSFAEVGSLPEQSSVLLTLTYCAHALRACLDYVKSLRVTPPTLAETDMTIPMRKLFATSHRGIFKTRNYATTCMPMTTPTDGNDISDEEDRAHDNAPQPQQTRLDYEKSLRVTPPTLAETAMTTPMRKLPATSHRGILKTRNNAATCLPRTTPKDGIDIPDKDDRAPVQVLRQRLKSEHADDLAEASHEALR